MAHKSDDIKRYREGSMSPAERHALEKKALSDPFLADALEGAELISAEEYSADVRGLEEKLRQPKTSTWAPLRIAAGIGLLLGAGYLLYLINAPQPVNLAMQELARPAVQADSSSRLADSASTLLSLAKPDLEVADAVKSSGAASAPSRRADRKIPNEKLAAAGASGEVARQEIQLQPAVPVIEEEKKVNEVADDKKEEAPAALATPTREAELNQRSTRAKRAADVSTSSQSFQNISGKVTSAEDGSALPGVNVTVKGSTTGAVTDANGNYQLNPRDTNPQLVFSYIGMHSVEARPSNGQALDVRLKEDVAQLSDVVVTGVGTKTDNDAVKEPVVKMAAPVGGIRAYNRYLENNLRYPKEALEAKIKGKVTVQFTVTTNGSLTEFNVLKGLGHGCDDEVIRLVKEGPRWTPTTQDEVPVESEVKVKMKFDPEKANR